MQQRNRIRSSVAVALALGGLALGACGGDDGDDEAAAPSHTLTDVRACFEQEGQKVREVELSFAKVPPDVDVSSKAGSADVWVAADEQAAEEIVLQHEELSKLGDQSLPESEVVVSGNAVATISSTSSPDYAAVIEECLPATG